MARETAKIWKVRLRRGARAAPQTAGGAPCSRWVLSPGSRIRMENETAHCHGM